MEGHVFICASIILTLRLPACLAAYLPATTTRGGGACGAIARWRRRTKRLSHRPLSIGPCCLFARNISPLFPTPFFIRFDSLVSFSCSNTPKSLQQCCLIIDPRTFVTSAPPLQTKKSIQKARLLVKVSRAGQVVPRTTRWPHLFFFEKKNKSLLSTDLSGGHLPGWRCAGGGRGAAGQ